MSPDEQYNLRQSIIKEIDHNNPSQETKDFMKETRDNFKEVSESLKSLEIHILEVKQIATETKAQAIKTNGRVGKLEDWRYIAEPKINNLNDESRERKKDKKDTWKQIKTFGIGKALDFFFRLSVFGYIFKEFIL